MGIGEEDQRNNFQNSTLQGILTSFSIATYLKIPDTVSIQGEEAVAHYIFEQLQKAAQVVDGLSFDVQVGKTA
jgi:hypothetical protein